jgi:hypothetical protein
LAFTGYEANHDSNHRLEVGPQSRFARVATLAPDELEPNNSFAAATPIPSLILPDSPDHFGTGMAVEKAFSRLNFHDQTDADYFLVSFQGPSHDDTDQANRPTTAGHSAGLGISYSHRPPELSCHVTPDDNRCMNVAVYRLTAGAPIPVVSEAKSSGITLPSPSRSLGAKQGYFVLANHNYTYSGAFHYGVRFVYTSAYDEIAVDTGAPAFQGQPTIRRKILHRLLDRLDLPRPGDDRAEVIRGADPIVFIRGYGEFLQEPEMAALLGENLRRPGGVVVAEAMHFLGQLARTFARVAEADRLFRQSADTGLALGEKGLAVTALESLADSYKSQGNRAALTKVSKEIRNLKPR